MAVKATPKKTVKKATPKKVVKKTKVVFKPTKIKLLTPVPSDIEIAQACKLKPILQIAEEVGLKPKRTGTLRQLQGQGSPGRARPAAKKPQRQVH